MAIDKLKTKFVTGASVNDVKHFFKKINEIIDWINNVGSTSVPNYKVYKALLYQNGTSNPTATIQSNNLGFVPTWTRDLAGYYTSTNLEWAQAVAAGKKITVSLTRHGKNTSNGTVSGSYASEDGVILIKTYNSSNSLADDILSDMDGFSLSTIIIEIA